MTATAGPYIGRFAPSPTGPLHFGSLLAAVASFLQARKNKGKWLLRIEDIDPPREQPGASDLIIAALERYGFEWDGPVYYQSQSQPDHVARIAELQDLGLAYRCTCSRKDLAAVPRGPLGVIYPGTCRSGCDGSEYAIRVRIANRPITFRDMLQGEQTQDLELESGDFVILRRDGLIAYHLAVVVDDELQGITEIVRGIDLLDSTPRQIYLQQLLEFHTPDYLHIPVAVNLDGQKLSKLTGAPDVTLTRGHSALIDSLIALDQQPPDSLGSAPVRDIWAWAIENWQLSPLIKTHSVTAGDHSMAAPQNGLS